MSNGRFQAGAKVKDKNTLKRGHVVETSEVWVCVEFDDSTVGWYLRNGIELVSAN